MRGVRMVCGLAALLAMGCRTATRVTEMPRVDLHMEGGGNRGFLIGTPPPPQAQDPTRQMIKTDVEIPSFYKPAVTSKPVDFGAPPPEPAMSEPAAMPLPDAPAGPPGSFDTYVVQKGDSLWSISKALYGRATQWRRIFDANRDLLKTPDSLRAGMTLKIPRAGGAADEGTSVK